MNEPKATQPDTAPGGLRPAVLRIFTTLMDMLCTRSELLFLDLREGSERLLGLLIWSLAGLLAAAMTLLLGAFSLIFIFWDTHRILVALLMAGFFAVLTLTAALVVRAKLRAPSAMFAATLDELSKDRQHFKAMM